MKKVLFLTLFLTLNLASAKGLFCYEHFKEKIFGLTLQNKHRNALSEGLEQADRLIEISKLVRAEVLQVPRDLQSSSHLESLAPVTQDLILFLESAEGTMPLWKRWPNHMGLFSKFKTEASTRIKEKNITYEWLLVFSLRVSILTDRGLIHDMHLSDFLGKNSWKEHDTALTFFKNNKDHSQFFPDLAHGYRLALPVPHDMGLFAINKLIANGILPLGHITNTAHVDGLSFRSHRFWRHDLFHAINLQKVSPHFFPYMRAYLEAAEKLPLPERIKAEFVIFYLSHETALFTSILISSRSQQKQHYDVEYLLRGYDTFLNDKGPEGLISFSQDPDNLGNLLQAAGVNINNRFAVRSWLEEASKVFEKVHLQTAK